VSDHRRHEPRAPRTAIEATLDAEIRLARQEAERQKADPRGWVDATPEALASEFVGVLEGDPVSRDMFVWYCGRRGLPMPAVHALLRRGEADVAPLLAADRPWALVVSARLLRERGLLGTPGRAG
jgi:hypothetical protein